MGAPPVTQKAAPPAKEERGCLTDLPPTIEGTTLVINTNRNGLQQQAASAALLGNLINMAIGHGARTQPSFHIGHSGSIALNLHYKTDPVMADLSAWGLVFGPYRTHSATYHIDGSDYTADAADIVFDGVNVRFTVAYPCNSVASLRVVR